MKRQSLSKPFLRFPESKCSIAFLLFRRALRTVPCSTKEREGRFSICRRHVSPVRPPRYDRFRRLRGVARVGLAGKHGVADRKVPAEFLKREADLRPPPSGGGCRGICSPLPTPKEPRRCQHTARCRIFLTHKRLRRFSGQGPFLAVQGGVQKG